MGRMSSVSALRGILQRSELSGEYTVQEDGMPPQGASAAEIEMHRQFLISQRAKQDAKLAEIGRQKNQKKGGTVDHFGECREAPGHHTGAAGASRHSQESRRQGPGFEGRLSLRVSGAGRPSAGSHPAAEPAARSRCSRSFAEGNEGKDRRGVSAHDL